ncbi:metallophosphoesterase [soil metagenome]
MTEPISGSRRAFLARLKWGWAPLLTSGSGAYAYGSMLERHRVVVERHAVKLALGESGPSKLRVVSLTDFHFDPLYETGYLEECVRKANALNPDVVLLTGDYISKTSDRIKDLAEVLGGLQAKVGIFACLGNHDFWDDPFEVRRSLRLKGIEVLMDQHTRVSCGDGQLLIAGLNSAWSGSPNWGRVASGFKTQDRALVLMHEPDFADQLAHDERAVMQFSGHTHGGQIRLPFLGALCLPSWGKNYQAGFYDVKNLKLHVNRGIGTVHYHVRFFCPPEISCFEIVNSDLA